jgi:hypothetical protein
MIIAAMFLSFSIYSCKPGKKEIAIGQPAYISATSLNCRKEPTSFGTIVGSFLQGDRVEVREKGAKKETIDGKENYWYLVEKGSVKGWVFGGYLAPVLYEKNELMGNYYQKWNDTMPPDNYIGREILSLDGDTYTMVSYSAKLQGEKAVEENGTVEFRDDSIVLRPQARKTKPNLLESGSPYGGPYDSSYQDSYRGQVTAGSTEEKKYSSGESETYKQTLHIRKLNGKFYLVHSAAVVSTQIKNETRYFEKN